MNVISKLRYWQSSRFATWSLPAIHDWDLIEWRRDVLDADQAEGRASVGLDAECSAQTIIHRINALSKPIHTWSRAHERSSWSTEEPRLINAARKSSER